MTLALNLAVFHNGALSVKRVRVGHTSQASFVGESNHDEGRAHTKGLSGSHDSLSLSWRDIVSGEEESYGFPF